MDETKRYKATVCDDGEHWVSVGELVDVGTQWCVRCHDILHANLAGWRSTEAEARRDAADQIERIADSIREKAKELREKFTNKP